MNISEEHCRRNNSEKIFRGANLGLFKQRTSRNEIQEFSNGKSVNTLQTVFVCSEAGLRTTP